MKLPDGSWVMFVKGFNNSGQQGPAGHNVTMAQSQDGHGPGVHQVSWNAAGLPNGAYVARLQAGEVTQTRTVMLVR